MAPGSPQLRSLVPVVVGLGLLVLGIEVYLTTSGHQGMPRWVSFALVLTGLVIAAIGPPLRGSLSAAIWPRLGGVLLLGLYLTFTAFTRYRGLAKDVEPTTLNVLAYYGKVTVASAAAVIAASLPRLAFTRNRPSDGGGRASRSAESSR
jgi:hypothetical protein